MGFNYRLEFDQLNVTLPSANAENSVANKYSALGCA